ncbi:MULTISPECIES: DUF982 domain-containing protein [unclassified Chelatococcus]|uniref:DUF982 domain-containing protein n=1 Tax=unclassified Chelatococcus TaxID=2638111 RepID=UPI001BD0BA2F|nr:MULTISPECIES: DUF982 domain-containing protein [unclassified Chelatococcus]CAH1654272.1 hypothetical protein CHELA41_20888 [Hyphomicrobiales bacterium]MBS7740229.1 DUF982 domain-containing protein [Chelatococcus sp. HY11]MBX3544942.1 DUF982 domain-containing protein [Chelatococcus sp.]MCO5078530.1 DUF982 domain-containing protein [Chelatococcus sp.]CAH1685464.1 hypothetical protein CHELA20_54038 [Hyphomicrobiales bacterium]
MRRQQEGRKGHLTPEEQRRYRLAKRRIREFEPVPVVVAKRGAVEICRLDDAVILLIGKWPPAFATSAKRLTAISLCREALEGRIWPDIARKAFVSAAEEAGLLNTAPPTAGPQERA